MTDEIIKYPRTPHLEGSRLQPGDTDDGIRLADLPEGMDYVWEEKLDGANTGVSFDEDANLVLQSRGHRLTGGPREKQFDLLKAWAALHQDLLFDVLGTRYVMYQEWMTALHTVYYDNLPHYAFEEDILDKQTGGFLSTDRRRALLEGTPFLSVPVLHRGRLASVREVKALVGPSLYVTENWRESLARSAERAGTDPVRVLAGVDGSGLSEGVYLKVEDPRSGTVVGRYKWVRRDFVQTILDSGSHWQDRTLVHNGLAPGVDLLAAPVPVHAP